MPTPAPTPAPLLACDFDNSTCGFDYTADYDWTLNSGGTSTWNTGPSSDHTSGSGYYMYVEADGNYNTGPFTLLSPTFAECVGEVSFYYHMYAAYGDAFGYMGTLQLEETTDGVSWTTIWTKSGNQGNSWQGATVSIATVHVIRVRWVGTTNSGWTSDMAIDDVIIMSQDLSLIHI